MRPMDSIEHLIESLDERTSSSFDQQTIAMMEDVMDQAINPPVGLSSSWGFVRWSQRSRLARLAVAAVMVVALLISYSLIHRATQRRQDFQTTGIQEVNQVAPRALNRQQEESALARSLSEQGDLEGLVTLLKTGLDATQIQVAGYLQEMGDANTLTELQALARQWQGDPNENPFNRAVEAIEQRITPASTEPNEVNQVSTNSIPVVEPQGVLCGYVTDAQTGNPVIGARVEVVKTYRQEAVTDANGFYCIAEIRESGPYKVYIWSLDYYWVTQWNDVPEVTLNPDHPLVRNFEVPRACRIEVEVVDEAGQPVQGVNLTISWMGQQYGYEVGRSRHRVQTDKGGKAILGGLKPSPTDYLLTGMRDDYGYGKAILNLCDPNQSYHCSMVMPVGQTVQGVAYYADGKPVTDMDIQALPIWWNILSSPGDVPLDANGLFTLDHIVPGPYRITVFKPNPGGGSTGSVVMETSLPPKEGILVVRLNENSPQEITEDGPFSIQGRIHLIGDHVVYGGIQVYAYSEQTGPVYGDCRSTGFSIEGLTPGRYDLHFSGKRIETKVERDVEVPNQDISVDLVYVGPPKIRGQVVSGQIDQPITAFRVRAAKIRPLGNGGARQSNTWLDIEDVQGCFAMDVVEPGIYKVQVAAAGYPWTWSEPVSTADAQPVVIHLGEGGSLRGRVVDTQGRPIDGAQIVALSHACGTEVYNCRDFVSHTGSVESRVGSFTLDSLAPGLESIQIQHPEYCTKVIRDIEILAGQETPLDPVVMKAGAVVAGVLYDAQGQPQPHETLCINTTPGPRSMTQLKALQTTVTDTEGVFHFEHLPTRRCYIYREPMYGVDGVVRCVVYPNDQSPVDVDLGGIQTMTGQILIAGQPLQRTALMISDPYRSEPAGFLAYFRTDDQGKFTLKGIPAGRYRLSYQLPKIGRYTSPGWYGVAVLEVTGEDQDIGVFALSLCSVNVEVHFADALDANKKWDFFIQAGDGHYGPRIGRIDKMTGASYHISGLHPGAFTAVIRSGGMSISQTFDVSDPMQPRLITMEIPTCRSSVSGELLAYAPSFLQLLRDDGRVDASVYHNDDTRYIIRNLPAGSYAIGSYYNVRTDPVARFTLGEGENLDLDIDMTGWTTYDQAHFHTQVINVGGEILSAAQIVLTDGTRDYSPYETNENGWFYVAPPGIYQLLVSCPGYRSIMHEVELYDEDFVLTGKADPTYVVTLTRLTGDGLH